MSTTRKKNNIFKVILSGVTAAVIIAASAGCGTVDLTMGKNNKNSSDNSVVEVIMPAQTTTTVTTTAVTTEVPLPVIYSKNAGKKVFPASTTKILTALTAIEYTAPEYEYYVGSELGLVAQDSSMSWIAEGSSLCRNEILTAMLAPSGNDAAYTIAVNVARKLYGITMMNIIPRRRIC